MGIYIQYYTVYYNILQCVALTQEHSENDVLKYLIKTVFKSYGKILSY